jgi:four helix bundle protein
LKADEIGRDESEDRDYGLRILDCGEESMNPEDMKARTRAFALRIIRLAESLPNTPTAKVIQNQMLRCGTSVGANYRAACRAKSRADFISKMGTVEEEADETIYWMELLIDADIQKRPRIGALLDEATEILSIVVSSIKTARSQKGMS